MIKDGKYLIEVFVRCADRHPYIEIPDNTSDGIRHCIGLDGFLGRGGLLHYAPASLEIITPGWYWLVTPDGEKTIEQIWDGYGHGALGMESPEGWVAVSEIYELGGVLYSIPPLEVSK